MTNRSPSTVRFHLFWVLALACGPFGESLRAQLLPKGIRTEAPVPQRPEGKWAGTARETLGDGKVLEYPLQLAFTGGDDALKLAVEATAKLPTEGGQTLTVAIRASYSGTFRGGRLALRSETIEVRVVETGEVVPSSPQQVQGTLEGGVLKGRVGSDDDGWTEFTARPAGAKAPAPAAAPGFTGRWRGTSREPGPEGRELQYPIAIEFTGSADSLRAEIAADLQYPLQGGGTTPVEYRATFRGRVQDGELQLRSEQVQIRLVQQGRTESGPQQQLSGRIDGGVLTATIGGTGQEVSRLELRPDAPTGQVPAAEPVRDGGRGADANAPLAYPTLVLERREITDPGLGGVPSHTMSIPAGWQFTGGPQWTGNPDNVVTFVGELRGPDAESLHFVAERQFSYSRVQSQLGVFDETDGRTKPDGSTARNAPKQPGEVAAEVIVPQLHPGATDIRVVEAERMPALEAALRELLKPQLDMMDALSAQTRGTNPAGVQCDSQTWLVVERSRVSYREGGVEWEEEVQCSILGMYGHIQTDSMRSDSGVWTLSQVRTGRARAGSLDGRLGALWLCADSLREVPRWSAAVGEIRLEIAKAKTASMHANFEEIRKRGEAAARQRSEISDIQMQSWRSQQDSLDRVHKARVDAIGEVHDFRSADGNLHTLTNHYDRAFKDQRGFVILTSDPNYRPAADPVVNQVTWEEMQRIDPFRQGR